MLKKRGQTSAASAAGLVSIIAGIIIVYILLLPPSEKRDLLEGTNHSSGRSSSNHNVTVLLDENVGRLDFIKSNGSTIDLPSVNIYKTTEAKEIESYNDFTVRNGLFDKKEVSQRLIVEDLENTENIVLSFVAETHSGILTIELNGKTVYDSEITTANIEPIRIRNQDIMEGENNLSFKVSGVGAAFWRTNEYALKNVKVLGDLTDLSRQKTTNVFVLESWKFENLEKAYIKFSPECTQSQVGVLEVNINDRNIFTGVPDCGLLNKFPIPIGALEPGTNDVTFQTNKGSYLVDRIEMSFDLEELTYPVYYFELTKEQVQNVSDDIDNATVTIKFVDDDNEKVLDLNVNGHLTRVQQEKPLYKRNIDSWVEEGQNYIKLIPKKDALDIVNLKVELIDADNNSSDD